MKIVSLLIFYLIVSSACSKPDLIGRAPGVVEGDIVRIRSQVAGQLLKIHHREGEEINRGDILAELDKEKLYNRFEAVNISEKELVVNRTRQITKIKLVDANIKYLTEQVQRLKRLEKGQAIAGNILETTRLKLMDAETSRFELETSLNSIDIQSEKLANQRKALQLHEKDLVLRSPVKGTILEIHALPGEALIPGATIVEILDNQSLYIEVYVEGEELAELSLNDPVKIQIDGITDRLFPGTISHFSKEAEFSPKYILSEKERKSLLYAVRIRISSSRDVYKIGMPVTVDFSR